MRRPGTPFACALHLALVSWLASTTVAAADDGAPMAGEGAAEDEAVLNVGIGLRAGLVLSNFSPQDWAALDGPYDVNAQHYLIQAAGFPVGLAARDRGFALRGQVHGGLFKYQVGAFDPQSGSVATAVAAVPARAFWHGFDGLVRRTR